MKNVKVTYQIFITLTKKDATDRSVDGFIQNLVGINSWNSLCFRFSILIYIIVKRKCCSFTRIAISYCQKKVIT